MKYDLTEKLKFNEDPVLVVKDVELTINSDAEAVLKLMSILQEKVEVSGATEVLDLLMSEKDRKKLSALHLKIEDYGVVVQTAIKLAMGDDPDEADTAGE